MPRARAGPQSPDSREQVETRWTLMSSTVRPLRLLPGLRAAHRVPKGPNRSRRSASPPVCKTPKEPIRSWSRWSLPDVDAVVVVFVPVGDRRPTKGPYECDVVMLEVTSANRGTRRLRPCVLDGHSGLSRRTAVRPGRPGRTACVTRPDRETTDARDALLRTRLLGNDDLTRCDF